MDLLIGGRGFVKRNGSNRSGIRGEAGTKHQTSTTTKREG